MLLRNSPLIEYSVMIFCGFSVQLIQQVTSATNQASYGSLRRISFKIFNQINVGIGTLLCYEGGIFDTT